MLVIGRREDEVIHIDVAGHRIDLKVVRVTDGRVRIGIEADREAVRVSRPDAKNNGRSKAA